MTLDFHSRSGFLSAAFHQVVLCGILLLTGCTVMDPEYKAREAAALIKCRGDEVVGVWVSKITNVGFPQRRTLLLRPGGTGLLRVLTEGVMMEPYEVSWKYSGGGMWDGTLSRDGRQLYAFKLRTTGRELLYRVYSMTNVHAIFVHADEL